MLSAERVDELIRAVDREGLLLLTAEGPYTRYGWPCYVTIRRRWLRYEVDWSEDGDGASALLTHHKRLNRAELEEYLRGLLEDDRPVRRLGSEPRDFWQAIDGSIVLGVLLLGGLAWLFWIAFFR